MMTALQIFKKHGAHYYLSDETAINEAMQEYAKQKVIEALGLAAKNAKVEVPAKRTKEMAQENVYSCHSKYFDVSEKSITEIKDKVEFV